jgi:hypothetical protein
MAFKASNLVPAETYRQVKGAAVQLKAICQGFNARLLANNADYQFLYDIYVTLARANSQFDALKTTPGLSTYAQSQEDDAAYDVAAEFTAMQSAINSAQNWMETNVPVKNRTVKSVNTWDSSDSILISDVFTPAQTAGLRTQLDAVIAAID